MKRRSFIRNSSAIATATWLGIHDLLAGCSPAAGFYQKEGARIIHLDLQAGTSLAELKSFYTVLIGLPLVSEQTDRFVIRAGETTISFIKATESTTAPFYHFAFNIPENKILQAREWQLKRTALSATPAHLIDQDYPADIRHFRSWNAHSVFFWDPAGNLVEYIARHDLANRSENEFSHRDLLCTSEIAFIVKDTESAAGEIKSSFSLDQYKGGDTSFRAIGDENGLLLFIKKGRVWESHTRLSKEPETAKTTVILKGDKAERWAPAGYPFEIIAKN